MAYSIKGNAIINDNRALLGVSTAGINTALYVGEEILADGAAGILTAKGIVVDNGDLNIQNGGDLIIGAGGSITAEGIFLEIDGESVGVATILPGGNLEVSNIDADGYVNVGAGLTLNGSLSFAAGDADEVVSGITTNLAETAGADELVTAAGAKKYVDDKIGGGSLLEILADNGPQGEIDLANDEIFKLEGTEKQIESEISVGLGNTVTFSLSDELVLPGSLEVTGLATFASNVEYGTGVSFSFADDATASVNSIGISSILAEDAAAETRLVSEKAIKQYVDGVEAAVEANAQLRLNTGDTEFGEIELSEENLGINGTDNEVVVVGAGNTYTLGLADSLRINGDNNAGGGLEVTGVTSVRAAGGAAGVADTLLDIQDGAINLNKGNIKIGGIVDFRVNNDLDPNYGIGFRTDASAGTGQTGQLIQFVGLSSDLQQNGLSASNSTLPTEKAVKEYVDSQVGGNTNAETITLADSADVNATYFIPFAASATGDEALVTDASQLTYNPSTGLLVAQDFNSLSDIRFKENVETITGATAKLEQIRGVEFDWKNTEGSSVGVIAQEVQALYPQLVTEGEEKLTVNYNGLTGLLIEAVKELSARVAELEGKA